MCQLLGMNCSEQTDFREHSNFRTFCRRGGDTDVHSHGWGICMYEEGGEYEQEYNDSSVASSSYDGGVLRSFHDKSPACESPIAEVLNNQIYPMRTNNMLAHIRYATKGSVSIENVHPFTRELWGIQWGFAHNGDIPKFGSIKTTASSSSSAKPKVSPIILGASNNNTAITNKQDIIYYPVGDTDSEAIFCSILNALNKNFNEIPTLSILYKFVYQLCNEIIHENATATNNNDTTINPIFNFLLSCGQYTSFAYSWPGARPGSKVWNGLYYILRDAPSSSDIISCDDNESIDDNSLSSTTTTNNCNNHIAVVTTKPLTDEKNWIEFQKDELIMFHRGLPYFEAESCDIIKQQQTQKQARGLQHSKCFERRRRRQQQQQQPLSSSLRQEQ